MRLTVVHSCIVAAVAVGSAVAVSAAVGAELICALREHCVCCCVQLILLSVFVKHNTVLLLEVLSDPQTVVAGGVS
jgi:hypothetical protein